MPLGQAVSVKGFDDAFFGILAELNTRKVERTAPRRFDQTARGAEVHAHGGGGGRGGDAGDDDGDDRGLLSTHDTV